MKFSKRLAVVMTGCAAALGASSSYGSACLQQASNAELLNELARRLYVGGGGGGGGIGIGARANYGCDLYGDLRLGLIGPAGEEAKAEVTIRNGQTCGRQRDVLTQFKSRIGQVALIGVCDLYGDLQRFSLTPDGRIQRLQEVIIRNIDTCLRQADAMNRQ
jgi:hypothetical protein